MELPVFPLHSVVFPDSRLQLLVFEDRYLALLDDVLRAEPFVVVAIRRGREVAGPAEPYRVGVTVAIEASAAEVDGSWDLTVRGGERVALLAERPANPYPRWEIGLYPDEGGAGTDDVEAAERALHGYLAATGDGDLRPAIPHEPVAASWAIAAAVPGLLPVRQELLETPGAGARLARARSIFVEETRIVRALDAGVAGPGPAGSPN